ncbi:MAG: S41 family peptidase [Saprospiraceae bacterium]|nr:S41 family peptidase [Saprospiraceae bacterium]
MQLRKFLVAITLLNLLLINGLNAQSGIPMDSVYTFIKNNSVYKNQVDWQQVDSIYKVHKSKSYTTEDSIQTLVQILKALGDVHSSIQFQGKSYGHYEGLEKNEWAYLKNFKTIAEESQNKIFRTKFLQGFVYIRIPGIQVDDSKSLNQMAQMLYDSIVLYTPERVRGYIVDLRLNTGGNVYPMLAGVSALLGEGLIAKESDADGRVVRNWYIHGPNVFADSTQLTYVQNRKLDAISTKPVVVLTGPLTASSGTFTAIAFKRRPNTLFIGEPTAKGYSSSLTPFKFSKEFTVNFANCSVLDRVQTVYLDQLTPDQIVYRGENFDHLLADKKIKAALGWLQKFH